MGLGCGRFVLIMVGPSWLPFGFRRNVSLYIFSFPNANTCPFALHFLVSFFAAILLVACRLVIPTTPTCTETCFKEPTQMNYGRTDAVSRSGGPDRSFGLSASTLFPSCPHPHYFRPCSDWLASAYGLSSSRHICLALRHRRYATLPNQ